MTRVGILLVALALFLGVTTGAGAAYRLITSKDIKNGTIQPVDLSPSVRQPARIVVNGSVIFSYTSTGPKTAMAYCPRGRVLLGGGFKGVADTASARVVVSESAPTEDKRGWQATGEYVNPNLLATLTAYALCAKS